MFDPRIKLDIAAAGALVPVHTYSTPDPEPPGAEGGTATVITRGVTEWVADAERQVSFGWDWEYDPGSRRLQGLWHTLRTNLVVVDDEGQELGESCTRLCAARLMTRAHWEKVLGVALGLPVALPN